MHKSNTCEKQKRVSMTVTFRSHACARLVLRTVGKELSGDGASQAYGYKIQTADNPGTMYKQRWTICTPLRRKLSSNFETTYKQYVRNDLIRMKLRKAEIPPPLFFFLLSSFLLLLLLLYCWSIIYCFGGQEIPLLCHYEESTYLTQISCYFFSVILTEGLYCLHMGGRQFQNDDIYWTIDSTALQT